MKLDKKDTKELRSGSYRIIETETAQQPIIESQDEDYAIADGYIESLRQMMNDNSKNTDLTN